MIFNKEVFLIQKPKIKVAQNLKNKKIREFTSSQRFK